MKGKERCKILKEIRAKIAEENGIEFAVSECSHKGDCLGTCPKCEAEVRYLERELERKRRLGKSIAVAGIAAGITLTSVGCSYIEEKLGGETIQGDMQVEEQVELDGLIPAPENDACVVETVGELAEEEKIEEIQGDIAPEEILMGEPVAYFLPATPEEYEGYDEFFINESLRGENIQSIRSIWGDEDMNQTRSDSCVSSYFTETMDIVIYYDGESGIISKVELIDNV